MLIPRIGTPRVVQCDVVRRLSEQPSRHGSPGHDGRVRLMVKGAASELRGRFGEVIFTWRTTAVGRVRTVVGISVQIGGYPMGRFAARVNTLHEWLLVKLP